MKKYQLYKELHHHRKLADKRSLKKKKKKSAKIMVYMMGTFIFLYLMFFAVTISLAVNSSHTSTALEIGCTSLPFIMMIDFFLRFVAQQTPSQLVKPYMLMPIPKYSCIDTFVITSLLSSENLVWFAFFLPFTIMSIVFSYGIIASIAFLLFCWICIMMNSQWYAISRTLINDNIFWWASPIILYSAIFIPAFYDMPSSFKTWNDISFGCGDMIEHDNPLPILIALGLLAVLIIINRRIQFKYVWKELAKTKKVTKLRSVSKFSFLEKYGELGLFMQLEMKSIIRNKNVKKTFIQAMVVVLIFSLLITFSDIYSDKFSKNFFGLYVFAILGISLLSRVMEFEGNYMDGLMIHKEKILSLLKAKYIFLCILMIFPLLLILPTLISGKWSVLMALSYMIFTCGMEFFILFQMAVYNNETLPLNEKLTSRNGMTGNYIQMLVTFGCFFLPIGIVFILQIIFSENTTYLIMLFIGLAFMLTKNLWLRNIYNRMMIRKYKNMESFRASR